MSKRISLFTFHFFTLQPHMAPHFKKIVSNLSTLIYIRTPAQFIYLNCLVFIIFTSYKNHYIFKVFKIIILLINTYIYFYYKILF